MLFRSHEIFERINSKRFLEEGEEGEIASELKYLEIVRDIRDNKPDLFERIKRLPKKARSAQEDAENAESVVTFFRKDKLKKMFLASKSDDVRELDFFETAELLCANQKTKRTKLNKDFYTYLEKNKEGFREATTETLREFKQKGGRSSLTALTTTVKAIQKFHGLTDDEEDFLNDVLRILNEGDRKRHV